MTFDPLCVRGNAARSWSVLAPDERTKVRAQVVSSPAHALCIHSSVFGYQSEKMAALTEKGYVHEDSNQTFRSRENQTCLQ